MYRYIYPFCKAIYVYGYVAMCLIYSIKFTKVAMYIHSIFHKTCFVVKFSAKNSSKRNYSVDCLIVPLASSGELISGSTAMIK